MNKAWLIGKWVLRIFAAVVAVAVVAIVLIVIAARYPTLVGPNRRFFRTCTSIRTGQTLTEARSIMSAYLEIDKNYIPDSSQAPFYRASIMGVRESATEQASRIVFIPSTNDSADWCIVYPQGDVVMRVEISPD